MVFFIDLTERSFVFSVVFFFSFFLFFLIRLRLGAFFLQFLCVQYCVHEMARGF